MIVGATNKSVDVSRGVLWFGTNLIENYKSLIVASNLWDAMRNSLIYALILTVLSLIVCSVAGYGFEVYHSKGKDKVMTILLLAMMVPFAAILVPMFKMFSTLGLLNSAIGFVLPTISTPFLIMLFRQSARSFPHDIIEAARLDGLNELQIFFRMFIPTMRSTYAAAMTITFMNAWNNYLWPKVIMLDDSSITMPMVVSNIIAGYVTDYGVLMLSVLFCTIPTVIIFFILQKSFAEGITGAVK